MSFLSSSLIHSIPIRQTRKPFYQKVGGLHFLRVGRFGLSFWIQQPREHASESLAPLMLIPIALMAGVGLGQWAMLVWAF